MIALSSVIEMKIKTVYPKNENNYDFVFNDDNILLHQADIEESSKPLLIMQSPVMEFSTKAFQPNHFVPLFI